MQPELSALSIVLRGKFNPAIFHPSWLALRELVRASEAEEASLDINHPEISEFSLGWARIQVTTDRFQLVCKQEALFEHSVDLVNGIFTVLSHTPVNKLGFNWEREYRIPDTRKYIAFGDMLAPKERWSNVINDPRVRELTMEEGPRKDGRAGYIRVRITPTAAFQGIHIGTNDHIELEGKDIEGAKEAIEIIRAYWEESQGRANEITETLISYIG